MYTKYVQKSAFTLFTEGQKSATIETSLKNGAEKVKQNKQAKQMNGSDERFSRTALRTTIKREAHLQLHTQISK